MPDTLPDQTAETCADCGAAIAFGDASCPRCFVSFVFCDGPNCPSMAAYPNHLASCPKCKAPNPRPMPRVGPNPDAGAQGSSSGTPAPHAAPAQRPTSPVAVGAPANPFSPAVTGVQAPLAGSAPSSPRPAPAMAPPQPPVPGPNPFKPQPISDSDASKLISGIASTFSAAVASHPAAASATGPSSPQPLPPHPTVPTIDLVGQAAMQGAAGLFAQSAGLSQYAAPTAQAMPTFQHQSIAAHSAMIGASGNTGILGPAGVGPTLYGVATPTGFAPTVASPIAALFDASKKFEANSESPLKFKLIGASLPAPVKLRATVSSSLLATARVSTLELDPGEHEDLEPVHVRPTRAAQGAHAAIDLMAYDAQDVPLGRWRGRVEFDVSKDPTEGRREINTGGGDYIVMGGQASSLPSERELMGMLAPASAAGGWQSVELKPDKPFMRRLSQTCPVDPTLVFSRAGEQQFRPAPFTGAPMLARVRLSIAGRRPFIVAVACGSSVAIGRGGKPGVHWALRPEPRSEPQTKRLSGQHARLLLKSQRAWIVDSSTNGVWVQGQKLTHGSQELLAAGDELDLARDIEQRSPHVVRFHAGIQAGPQGVGAVLLTRDDDLRDALAYLLMDNSGPARITIDNAELHLGWMRGDDGGLQLIARAPSMSGWAPVPRSQECRLAADASLFWEPASEQAEQEWYLRS